MSIAKKIRRFAQLRFDVIRPITKFDLSRKVILSPGYYPTNPSFVDTDRGRLLYIRGVNYRTAIKALRTGHPRRRRSHRQTPPQAARGAAG